MVISNPQTGRRLDISYQKHFSPHEVWVEYIQTENIGSCCEKIDFDNQPLLDTDSMSPLNTHAQGVTVN